MPTQPLDSATLRQRINQQRRALDSAQLALAGQALHQRLIQHLAIQPQRDTPLHIAVYRAVRGEMPLELDALHQAGASLYLPVVQGEQMRFAPWQPGDVLLKRGMGLLEPASQEFIDPTQLDRVLAPLVAFDPQCQRIGMGGGFYDRCFAFRRDAVRAAPQLIGIAHEFQRHDALPVEEWDVPLDAVITDAATYIR